MLSFVDFVQTNQETAVIVSDDTESDSDIGQNHQETTVIVSDNTDNDEG